MKDSANSSPALRASLDHVQYLRAIATDAFERFLDHKDLLWASALTYTSALSIVPLFVLAFALLKGLGYTDTLEPLIRRYLAVGSPETTRRLLGFVSGVKASALGSAGAITLLITDVSTLGTVESAFNNAWGVAQGRSYLRKFTDYLSVTFTVPIVLVTALTLATGSAAKVVGLPGLSFVASFILTWAGFLFLFIFFPYTRVEYRPAAIGSFITAALWSFAQWAYVYFQYGVSSYHAYYGALAAIPIFLVWIYFSWAIVMLGVELSVVLQRGVRSGLAGVESDPDFARRAALLILTRIGDRMAAGGAPATAAGVAHELGVAPERVAPVIERLRGAGILADATSAAGRKTIGELLLTRSPRLVRVGDALASLAVERHTSEPRVDATVDRIRASESEALAGATVLDLLGPLAAAAKPQPARR